jgi:hypothetical protein
MIGAPFLVVLHDVFEDAIHLLNYIHLHQLTKLNFSGHNDGPDNLNSECVKFYMVDFKV